MTTPTPPARSAWLSPLGVVAIVVLALVAGVALDRFVLLPPPFRAWHVAATPGEMRHDPAARKRMADQFAKDLGLTPAQRTAVDTIMAHQGARMHAAREQLRPAMDSIVHETQRQIDSVLTPEQRTKFAALRERWQREHPRQDSTPNKT